MATAEWDLAGFTGDDGELGRHVLPGYLTVPGKIDVEGNELVWEMSPDGNSLPKSRLPNRRMLRQFTDLANAKAGTAEMLAFARRFGPLSFGPDGDVGSPEIAGREHIQVWKSYAATACAILDIAAAIKNGKPGKHGDWEIITPIHARFPDHGDGFPPKKMRPARFQLQRRLRAWAFRRPTFELEWREGRWETRLDYGGMMFPALSLQLLLAVGNFQTMAICSGAGCENQIYGRKRAPKSGQANFCPQCKAKGEDLRQADRRRKDKMAAARRLFKNGVPIAAIATQLPAKKESVTRWVKAGARR